jgi:ribonuclease P protein component
MPDVVDRSPEPFDAPGAGGREPGRLRARSEYLAAAKGRKLRSRALTLQVLDRIVTAPHDSDAREPVAPAGIRVGFTAARHVGNAPERNRIRRRLRAAARLAYANQPHALDIVAVARREVLGEPFGRLIGALRQALAPAGRKPPHAPST